MTSDTDSECYYFVLDETNTPVRASAAEWMDFVREPVIVAQTELPNGGMLTTHFRGEGDSAADYFMSEYGPEERLLFETYSKVGEETHLEDEYPSWAEAEAGHQSIVARYEKLFAPRAAAGS